MVLSLLIVVAKNGQLKLNPMVISW